MLPSDYAKVKMCTNISFCRTGKAWSFQGHKMGNFMLCGKNLLFLLMNNSNCKKNKGNTRSYKWASTFFKCSSFIASSKSRLFLQRPSHGVVFVLCVPFCRILSLRTGSTSCLWCLCVIFESSIKSITCLRHMKSPIHICCLSGGRKSDQLIL